MKYPAYSDFSSINRLTGLVSQPLALFMLALTLVQLELGDRDRIVPVDKQVRQGIHLPAHESVTAG
jgi:hypothetical protein